MTRPSRREFDHEKLTAYVRAVEFLAAAEGICEGIPVSRRYLSDQLLRAATSVALNIAEGAGEFSPREKCRFYRMAIRSATECSAVLDALRAARKLEQPAHESGRLLLLEIVALLTATIRKLESRV